MPARIDCKRDQPSRVCSRSQLPAGPWHASLTATIVAVLTGGALAVFLDCALPFAFELLPSNAFGLSSGLYIGGAFAGSGLLSALVPRF